MINNYKSMKKYILNFSKLNSSSDVECLEFTSAKKRASFIADKVISNNPKKAFTYIVKYSENDEHSDVYVFTNWSCIQEIVEHRWQECYLFEWESYEDAYSNALKFKEIDPLCYS